MNDTVTVIKPGDPKPIVSFSIFNHSFTLVKYLAETLYDLRKEGYILSNKEPSVVVVTDKDGKWVQTMVVEVSDTRFLMK